MRNVCSKIFALLVVSVLLVACGHVPLTSMVKLRSFDPLTANIEELAVAVQVPDAFKVGIDGVQMTIEMAKIDGSETRREAFILSETSNEADQRVLDKFQKPGLSTSSYRVLEKDYERMNAIRDLAKQNEGKKNWKGSVGIGTKICRKSNIIPKSVLVTTYLKTENTNGYIPFLVNVDVVAQTEFGNIDTWAPLCE